MLNRAGIEATNCPGVCREFEAALGRVERACRGLPVQIYGRGHVAHIRLIASNGESLGVATLKLNLLDKDEHFTGPLIVKEIISQLRAAYETGDR